MTAILENNIKFKGTLQSHITYFSLDLIHPVLIIWLISTVCLNFFYYALVHGRFKGYHTYVQLFIDRIGDRIRIQCFITKGIRSTLQRLPYPCPRCSCDPLLLHHLILGSRICLTFFYVFLKWTSKTRSRCCMATFTPGITLQFMQQLFPTLLVRNKFL